MWNETKQLQLNELQRHESRRSLTVEEHQLLEKLVAELEQAEWQSLNFSLETGRKNQCKLQDDIGRAETQNAVLFKIPVKMMWYRGSESNRHGR